MGIILTLIFAVIGYFGINQAILSQARDPRTANVVSITVLFLYLCGVAAVGLMFVSSGYDWFVLYSAMILVSVGVIALYAWRIYRNRIYLDLFGVCGLLLAAAAILYLTVFMRLDMRPEYSVRLTPFDRINRAFLEQDISIAYHFLMNIAMFLPFGFFLKCASKSRTNNWGNAMLIGLMFATVIETVQMVFHLGQCDIDDIIANTLGSILGFGIASLQTAIGRNWKF